MSCAPGRTPPRSVLPVRGNTPRCIGAHPRWPGSSASIVTADARISRSTSAIAAVMRSRCVGAERSQQRGREILRLAVERIEFPQSFPRQHRPPHPAVVGGALRIHQALRFERTEHPAEIARIQRQPRAQIAQIRACPADLEQQPRFAERPAAAEIVVRQHADPLRNGPVEAADLLNLAFFHLSDFSQVNGLCQSQATLDMTARSFVGANSFTRSAGRTIKPHLP